jgi:hypothetical protein
MSDKPYRDPGTLNIEDWKWHPMEHIERQLSARRELPEHVLPYAEYMQHMADRAQHGGISPRDLIKAHTITQSSIGRGGLSHATATKRGMHLPNTGGEVRPEGAFSEWLGSPMGQHFLDAAERGDIHPEAMEDIRAKFAPFGKQNAQVDAMRYAAENMPGMAEHANRALTGSKEEYRDFAKGIKGIAGAKSGFIGSLLGRGDQPTLDARQLNLHSLSHPTKAPESMMSRGRGAGGQEAVDRLSARHDALGYDIPHELLPHAQHLIHHDIWDQLGGTQTTHEDLIRAMRGYAAGGDVHPHFEQMARELAEHHAKGGEEYKYPQDEALEQARLNAIRLLGLHEHNTPHERARAMGFTGTGFHSTAHDIDKIDPHRAQGHAGPLGNGFYIDPSDTASYSNFVNRILDKKHPGEPRRIMPVMYKPKDLFDATHSVAIRDPESSARATKALQEAGHSGAYRRKEDQSDTLHEVAMYDPSHVRSRFAAFDPARAHEAGLSYAEGGEVNNPSVEQMARELAEHHAKGGQPEKPRLLNPEHPEHVELMRRYLNGERIGAADNVRLGLNHPVSAVKLRAPIHELSYRGHEDPDQPMVPQKRITPEDLYKSAGIPFIGDAARLGMLTHVGDKELPRPVRLQAGADFMRGIKPEGEEAAWASAPHVITHLSNQTQKASDIPGVEHVYGMHTTMTPTGVDFARPLSRVLTGMLEGTPPKKKTAKIFDTAMRSRFPEFVGIGNPELLHDQLMAQNLKSASMRKAFVTLMDSAPFQNAGMPSVGHARVAISDPEQLHLPTHSVGLGISKLDPTGRIIKNPSMPHEDYAHHLAQKEYRGRFEVPMSRNDVFSDFDARRRSEGADTASDPRAFSMSSPIQHFDQKWLDTIMPKYLAKREESLGYADGGEVGPSYDDMLAHVILHKADGGSIRRPTEMGVDEAPNSDVKWYMPPNTHDGQGNMPVGGVDFNPHEGGQQFAPPPPQGASGQPPQGAPGQPQGMPSPTGPQAPAGPPSSILNMTRQGQAMSAMKAPQAAPPQAAPPQAAAPVVAKPNPSPLIKNGMARMAEGGSAKPVVRGIIKEQVTVIPNLDAMKLALMKAKR